MQFYPWLQNQREIAPDTPQLSAGAESGLTTRERSVLAPPSLSAAGDVGSQVGVRRNLEFSAGERAHRISMGSYTRA